MKQQLNCYDSQACIRCSSCMVNCSVENRVRLQRENGIGVEKTTQDTLEHLNYLMPRSVEIGTYPEARKVTAFHHCNHCEKAPCAEICPTRAIAKRPGGEVVINRKACIGCRSCGDACPYEIPVYSKDNQRAYKCIRCYDRVENGLTPACVEGCPTTAMFSGNADEVLAEAKKRAELYSAKTGEAYVVYGADAVNSYVGKTGWLTIAPKRDAELYALKSDPYKAAMGLRSVAKVGGGVAAAAAVAGTAAHFMYWLAARKKKIKEGAGGEQ